MISLSSRDVVFAAINGFIIGLLAPFIFNNLGAHIPFSPILFGFILSLLAIIDILAGYLLGKLIRPFFYQLSKFGLVGVGNTVIDTGVFSFLIFLSGITSGLYITVFRTLSVTLAIVNSYLWNKYWSFQKKDSAEVPKEFAHFVIISLVGMVLNVGITSFLVNVLGPQGGLPPAAWATLAGIIPVPIVLMWNFVGYKLFVFKK